MKIVATTLLPAVDHPNADHWNAARSCQNGQENNYVFSASNVVASQLPECRPTGTLTARANKDVFSGH